MPPAGCWNIHPKGNAGGCHGRKSFPSRLLRGHLFLSHFPTGMLPLSYSFCLSESYRSSFNPFCFIRSFLTLQKAVIAPSDELLGNLCWCYLTFWIVFLILSVVFFSCFSRVRIIPWVFVKSIASYFIWQIFKKKILGNLGEKHLDRNLTKVNELQGFPGGSVIKNSPANAGGMGLIPGSGRSPGEENWKPPPVLLLGKFRGQRSLAGYSP